MDFQVSKSDIDFDLNESSVADYDTGDSIDPGSDFESGNSAGADDAAEGKLAAKFNHSMGLEMDLLARGLGASDSDCSIVSISDAEEEVEDYDDDDDYDSSEDSFRGQEPMVVPLKTDDDDDDCGGQRQRRSRGDLAGTGVSFRRRAPARTKSCEGGAIPAPGPGRPKGSRRPPVRTKSGGSADGGSLRRTAPRRTKSGDGTGARNRGDHRGAEERDEDDAGAGEASPGTDAGACVVPAPPSDGDSGDHGPGTGGRVVPHQRTEAGYREKALERNAARRQRSSDTLGAMRNATRKVPSRPTAPGGPQRRRPPGRTKSNDGLPVTDVGGGPFSQDPPPSRRPVRRRPPARTKSGDGPSTGNKTPAALPLEL